MMEVHHARVTGESPSPLGDIDGSGTSGHVDIAHEPSDVGVPSSSATCPVCVACDRLIEVPGFAVAEAGPMHHACAYDAMKGAHGAFALPSYSYERWIRLAEPWVLQLWRAVRDERQPRRPVDNDAARAA